MQRGQKNRSAGARVLTYGVRMVVVSSISQQGEESRSKIGDGQRDKAADWQAIGPN